MANQCVVCGHKPNPDPPPPIEERHVNGPVAALTTSMGGRQVATTGSRDEVAMRIEFATKEKFSCLIGFYDHRQEQIVYFCGSCLVRRLLNPNGDALVYSDWLKEHGHDQAATEMLRAFAGDG